MTPSPISLQNPCPVPAESAEMKSDSNGIEAFQMELKHQRPASKAQSTHISNHRSVQPHELLTCMLHQSRPASSVEGSQFGLINHLRMLKPRIPHPKVPQPEWFDELLPYKTLSNSRGPIQNLYKLPSKRVVLIKFQNKILCAKARKSKNTCT